MNIWHGCGRSRVGLEGSLPKSLPSPVDYEYMNKCASLSPTWAQPCLQVRAYIQGCTLHTDFGHQKEVFYTRKASVSSQPLPWHLIYSCVHTTARWQAGPFREVLSGISTNLFSTTPSYLFTGTHCQAPCPHSGPAPRQCVGVGDQAWDKVTGCWFYL